MNICACYWWMNNFWISLIGTAKVQNIWWDSPKNSDILLRHHLNGFLFDSSQYCKEKDEFENVFLSHCLEVSLKLPMFLLLLPPFAFLTTIALLLPCLILYAKTEPNFSEFLFLCWNVHEEEPFCGIAKHNNNQTERVSVFQLLDINKNSEGKKISPKANFYYSPWNCARPG